MLAKIIFVSGCLVLVAGYSLLVAGWLNRVVHLYFNNVKRRITSDWDPVTSNYLCMMEVNDALINKLADLARLQIQETERSSIKKDLQDMIAFVEKLNELDLAGVEPLLHISNASNHLRDDIAQSPLDREEALRNAPLHDDKFFKVPKVIKK